ncbi:hypothetical protein GQ464_004445 [Rhodocaloribacter litoris]|uniref:hypothetical protein n=1 Tax=Rhodocaloribacter litoris TaxID=2558931 RepID=UPI001E5B2FBF|nr:hypothetical protein [Rhodocaloribacter litoris]QXD16210.1 hypothetical protein GQ464_004445 [Rhodocaloribacter litoris]
MNLAPAELLLIDAHVHLHDCFVPVAFLEAAHANFSGVARQEGGNRRFTGVLFLTEGAGECGFERLRALGQAFPGGSGGRVWRRRETDGGVGLVFTSDAEEMLVVLAGRQIVTREHMEVLAVGTRRRFEDGQPIEDVIRAVAGAGALPIVPWGFGKWFGARGRRLRRLLTRPDLPLFFLGDSAKRPVFWPRSPLFRLAAARGVPVLPGSDPLPFRDEYRRAGSFGVMLPGSVDHAGPAHHIKTLLAASSLTLRAFGRRDSPGRFVRNQAGMQFLKRVRKASAHCLEHG